MMNNNFVSGNLNLEQADENKNDLDIPLKQLKTFHMMYASLIHLVSVGLMHA